MSCWSSRDVGGAQRYNNCKRDSLGPNCYGYAAHLSVNLDPGSRSNSNPDWYNVYSVAGSIIDDMNKMGCTARFIGGPNSKISKIEYRVALRVGTKNVNDGLSSMLFPHNDYHMMVQTITGAWAEKHGVGSDSILWDIGMTPDNIPWTYKGKEYYDSDIVYLAFGE